MALVSSKLSIKQVVSVLSSFILGTLAMFMFIPSSFVQQFHTTGFFLFLAFVLSLDTFRTKINKSLSMTIFNKFSTTILLISCLLLGFYYIPLPAN